MVRYKESKVLDIVTITGVTTHERKTWSFGIKVLESSFVDTLLLVVEGLAEAAFNKSLQLASEPGDELVRYVALEFVGVDDRFSSSSCILR